MSDARLPAWGEIRDSALGELHAAGVAVADALDWLRAVDSPLTDAQKAACREAFRIAAEAKGLIEQARDALGADG